MLRTPGPKLRVLCLGANYGGDASYGLDSVSVTLGPLYRTLGSMLRALELMLRNPRKC